MGRVIKSAEQIQAEKKADADRIAEYKEERDQKARNAEEAKRAEKNEEAIPAQGNLKDENDYEEEQDSNIHENKHEDDPKPPKERKSTKPSKGKAEKAARASVDKHKSRGRKHDKRRLDDHQNEDTSLSDRRSTKSNTYENEQTIVYTDRDESLSSVSQSRSVTPLRRMNAKRKLLDKLKSEKQAQILRMKIKTKRYHELASGMLASEDEAIPEDMQLLDPDLKVLREEILARLYDK